MPPTNRHNFFHVDAFTDTPFGGNPAAVVILTKAADPAWMQRVAAEINLSETAFAWPHEDPFKRAWRLRWFTPIEEVSLCGHGTLATAYVLWSEGYLRPNQTAQFATQSGRLSADYALSGTITLDFPASPLISTDAPRGLLDALGVASATIYHNEDDYIVVVDSAETVRHLTPNFTALARLTAIRRAMITAPADTEQYDFISRYFTQNEAMPEDPVTGAAHCKLAPFWGNKLGKTTLIGYQASARGGTVHTELVDERVKLSGKAVTIIKGYLLA